MGEFVAKKYDNTSHMVWWNGHGMICRTDSLGNAARIADALNAQAAPPAAAVSASGHFEVLRELSATLIGRSQERHAAIEWALERIEAQPAGAVPADDAIEAAYWDFDARHKGYGPHKITPQSERDAFKWAVRAMLAAANKENSNG